MIDNHLKPTIMRDRCRLVCFDGRRVSPEDAKCINELGMSSSVQHISGSDATLYALYRSAVVLVDPSLYEGFDLQRNETAVKRLAALVAAMEAKPA